MSWSKRFLACSVFMLLVLLPCNGVAATVGGEFVTSLSAQQSGVDCDAAAQSLLRLQLKAGAYPWRLYVDGSTRLAGPIGDPGWDVNFDLERYYIKASVSDVDINVGKQQISWGLGYAWAPTDLFSPPNPQDPNGRREGVEALVVRIPTGPLEYWSAVVARRPNNVGSEQGIQWQYALRRHGNLFGTDWSALAIRGYGVTVLGGDLKLDYGPSWTAEAAYFIPDDAASRWEGVFGIDYSWLGGRLLWRGEYLYNSAGATDKSQYDFAAMQEGKLKHPAKHYLFNQVSGQIDMFSSMNVAVLANMVDSSSLWTLGGQTQLSSEWRLAASVSKPIGEAGGEYALGPGLISMVQAEYSF